MAKQATQSRKRPKQLAFEIKTHGGKRAGAGRKKLRRGEPNHVPREKVTARTPVHVTLKLHRRLPSLRTRSALVSLADAIRGSEKFGLRVVHFSLQSDHVHLIAEADTTLEFSKGMQSLSIRFAKAIKREIRKLDGGERALSDEKIPRTEASLNEHFRVFRGRYHAHVLKTPAEVKHALAYVLQNTSRHWEKAEKKKPHHTKTGAGTSSPIRMRNVSLPRTRILVQDPLSSLHLFEKPIELFGAIAATPSAREYFEGNPSKLHQVAGDFLSKPKSWLLKTGWTRARSV